MHSTPSSRPNLKDGVLCLAHITHLLCRAGLPINRYEAQGAPDRVYTYEAKLERPAIGGWLLFFCFSSFAGCLKSLQVVPATKMPLFLALYSTLLILNLLATFTVWLKTDAALNCVRLWLASRMLYALLQVYLGSRMSAASVSNGMSQSDTEFYMAAGNMIYVVIWYLYFHISIRVRETFGRNL